jgi:hypothetical protein
MVDATPMRRETTTVSVFIRIMYSVGDISGEKVSEG